MLKNLFGPKMTSGRVEPVEVEVLRKSLLELFPSEGEFNKYLKIEPLENSPHGFIAAVDINTICTEEGTSYARRNITISVDIKPQDKSVHFAYKEKGSHIDKHTLKEELNVGVPFYDVNSRYTHMRVGRLEDLKAHEKAHIEATQSQRGPKIGTKETRYLTYRFWMIDPYKKRISEELVGCATRLGWDAYF